MLLHLSIRNLALVEQLNLTLSPGLNVLTGETGAGKSILVSAFSLLLGSRASPDIIRDGTEEATVEGLFEVCGHARMTERLNELGIEAPDGQVVVRRVLRRRGRGRVLINGQMATLSMLSQLLHNYVDLTSQHEHVALLDPSLHLDLLDEYGQLDELRRNVYEAYQVLAEKRAELSALDMDEKELARRKDYLGFSLEEIELLSPSENELELLSTERRRLRRLGELEAGLAAAELSLYSMEGAVVGQLERVAQQLSELSVIDDQLEPWVETANRLAAEAEDLARGIDRHQRGLHAEPHRLAEVEDRIAKLERLVRKHGGQMADVIELASKMRQELEVLDGLESRRGEIEGEIQRLNNTLSSVARELSAARKAATFRLEREARVALTALGMKDTGMVMSLRPLTEAGPRGFETAEILFSPNKGESLRPLRKTASGGELSRVLLGLKRVLASRNTVGLHVFDEVDTGIGGAVAEAVGGELARVAREHQVVVVTHLPQVAAFAERHLRVFKRAEGGRTVTEVEVLNGKRGIEEIARMLAGVKVTPRTKALAKELRRRAVKESGRLRCVSGGRDRQDLPPQPVMENKIRSSAVVVQDKPSRESANEQRATG